MIPGALTPGAEEIGDRLASARSIVVLTGAGISVPSGLSTFRDPDGLWKRFRPEDLANEAAFRRDPQLVQGWYTERRNQATAAFPNAGHHALVDLEKGAEDFLLVTQNVDGLHTRAGSHRVIELHGSIMDEYCIDCCEPANVGGKYDTGFRECSVCSGLLRPGVVWFGEALPENSLERAMKAAEHADIFLSVGTSSVVYPAAGLPLVAKDSGAFVVEVNVKPSAITNVMDRVFLGTANSILPDLVRAAGYARETSARKVDDHWN